MELPFKGDEYPANRQAVLNVLVHDHVPATKLRWQVTGSFALLRVTDYNGTGANPDAWLAIEATETYTPRDGQRQVSRSVHITLSAKERAELLAMLLRTPEAPPAPPPAASTPL